MVTIIRRTPAHDRELGGRYKLHQGPRKAEVRWRSNCAVCTEKIGFAAFLDSARSPSSQCDLFDMPVWLETSDPEHVIAFSPYRTLNRRKLYEVAELELILADPGYRKGPPCGSKMGHERRTTGANFASQEADG